MAAEETLIWVEHQCWQALASSSCFQPNSSNNWEHINKNQRLTKSQSCPLSGFWPGWSVSGGRGFTTPRSGGLSSWTSPADTGSALRSRASWTECRLHGIWVGCEGPSSGPREHFLAFGLNTTPMEESQRNHAFTIRALHCVVSITAVR